jgi:hypothetical protein
MLAALDERLSSLKVLYPEMSIKKQDYDKEKYTPFILAIVTPLMKRVHLMVSNLVFVGMSSNDGI